MMPQDGPNTLKSKHQQLIGRTAHLDRLALGLALGNQLLSMLLGLQCQPIQGVNTK